MLLRAAGGGGAVMLLDVATANDLPAVRRLLSQHHLPLDGVDDLIDAMVLARRDATCWTFAAIELYPDGALFVGGGRSRGTGTAGWSHAHPGSPGPGVCPGRVHRVPADATAEAFFPRFGFERISRDEVPLSVQAVIEFQSACPASAVVMRKYLSD